MLPDVDGRSTWVRRLRDVMALHLSDLGGEAAVSEAERSIIRRASTLTVELERMESKFANAGEADKVALDLYQRTAGNLRRLLESVGLGAPRPQPHADHRSILARQGGYEGRQRP